MKINRRNVITTGLAMPAVIAMSRLGFEKLVDAKASRSRDLVMAMVCGRIIAPEASKLGMTRAWADTTLADDLGVADAHEDELYAAMDWLIERQEGASNYRLICPIPLARTPQIRFCGDHGI